jgi:cobaltochelatase CobS
MTHMPKLKVQLSEFGLPGDLAFQTKSQEQHPNIPAEIPYHFRPELAGDMIKFLMEPGGDSLLLTGPTGSGKTSIMLQIAARFRWPVQALTCHGQMEMFDLVGRYVPQPIDLPVFTAHGEPIMGPNGQPRNRKDMSLVFKDGPLSTAMRHGHILILDEFDTIEPGVQIGLNSILDGGSLTVPETGEVIHPHENFRVVVTANTAGFGDQTGLYVGTNTLNVALMDRFMTLKVGYATVEEEVDTIKRVNSSTAEALGSTLVNAFAEIANSVRERFVGTDDQQPELRTTISTRALLRWMRLTLQHQKAPRPWAKALELAVLNRAPAQDREAIMTIAEAKLG